MRAFTMAGTDPATKKDDQNYQDKAGLAKEFIKKSSLWEHVDVN